MTGVLVAKKRNDFGKGAARRLRRQGFIPAVYYSHGEKAIPLSVDEKTLLYFMQKAHGLIELNIEGIKKNQKCIFKDIQYDPVTDEILHVDFQGVKMGEKITMTVPLVLKGTPVGVKSGGILEHLIREIEIECLPRYIPEYLELDVSELKIGDVIHIKDLQFENIKILEDPEETVVLIEMPRKAEVIEVEEEAEETLFEEPTEPEVITAKKGEKEEESEESSS